MVMMQTFGSHEEYMSYLQDIRDRDAAAERDRRDPRHRCEHGVSTLRTCKGCGIPEYWDSWLQRAWAAEAGPGLAVKCECGVTTRSDTEWDEHMPAEAEEDVRHSPRP